MVKSSTRQQAAKAGPLPKAVAVWEAHLPSSCVEAAEEILQALGHPAPVQIDHPGRARSVLALYLSPSVQTRALTRQFKQRLGCACEVRRKLLKNWQESWKRTLRVQRIAPGLVICPTSTTYRPAAKERVIRLDPGMAFGTGHHATTRFVLRMMLKHPVRGLTWLDVGTGSGVLTIAAALFGASKMTAIDHDPLAVQVAGENFTRNGVSGVRLRRAALESFRERTRYDWVAANLETSLILGYADQLICRVRPGGVLCVTGIGRLYGEQVRMVYERAGLTVVGQFHAGQWCGFCFRRPGG